MSIKKTMKLKEYGLIYCNLFVLLFLSVANGFSLNHLEEIFTHSSVLVADYFKISNVGSTYFNLFLMQLLILFLMLLENVELDSNLIASIYLILGFSYYGKNPLNTFPLVLGSYLYNKAKKNSISQEFTNILGVMGISPFITELMFFSPINPSMRIGMSIFLGGLIGALLQPLNKVTQRWHNGLSLYSMGLSIGIISIFFVGIYKFLGVSVEANKFSNVPVRNIWLLTILMLVLLVYAFLKEQTLKNYMNFIKNPNDRYWKDFPYAVLMNVSVNVLLSLVYIKIFNIPYSGPVIGGVLAVAGYSFNYIGTPSYLSLLISMGSYNFLTNKWITNDTLFAFVSFYGTCLTPVFYRVHPLVLPVAVVLNGYLVQYTSLIHDGMVLYNTGFAAGIIATVISVLNKSRIFTKKIKCAK